jgi:hypothetical protein
MANGQPIPVQSRERRGNIPPIDTYPVFEGDLSRINKTFDVKFQLTGFNIRQGKVWKSVANLLTQDGLKIQRI